MSQYVALTTQNASAGWEVVAFGTPRQSKAEVRAEAEKVIVGDQVNQAKDIFVDTELKNLVVLAVSTAQRRAEWRAAIERWCDADPDDN